MVLAVIPARFSSGRLPGKPLADIGGRPMVVRVWERVRRAQVDRVVVATDDARIGEAARAVGAEVVMTGECASGTDRVAAAAAQLRAAGVEARVVVNVQGDEPLLDPQAVDRVVAGLGQGASISTGATPLDADVENPARVKVVADDAGCALYFSRLPIPHGGPWRLHVGLYAFTAPALRRVAALPAHPLEAAERLEQLRWLAAGERIAVVDVPAPHPSVDTPEDLARVRALWAALPAPPAPTPRS